MREKILDEFSGAADELRRVFDRHTIQIRVALHLSPCSAHSRDLDFCWIDVILSWIRQSQI